MQQCYEQILHYNDIIIHIMYNNISSSKKSTPILKITTLGQFSHVIKVYIFITGNYLYVNKHSYYSPGCCTDNTFLFYFLQRLFYVSRHITFVLLLYKTRIIRHQVPRKKSDKDDWGYHSMDSRSAE